MGYTGKPSSGCQRCRHLKVKCDAEKPACNRCTRAGRECPGYERADGAPFRSMNQSSEAKVRTRVRRRLDERAASNERGGNDTPNAAPSSARPSSEAGMVVRRSSPLAMQAMALPQTMPMDWEGQAVELLFSRWVEAPDALRSYEGSYMALPDMYRRSAAPHLREAVHAAALAGLHHASLTQELDRMGQKAYGKALVSLGRSMAVDPGATASMETLMTINLLSVYEVRVILTFRPAQSDRGHH